MRKKDQATKQLVAPTRRLTALVVDDEDSVLAHARKLLDALQITVCTATGPSEALSIASLAEVDIALIDLRLGSSNDGIALGRLLQRDHGMAFVLFSGFLNTEIVVQAMENGAADVIDKPLRRRRLWEAIERARRRERRTDEELGKAKAVALEGEDSVSRRWAEIGIRACHAEKDPNTEAAIGKAGGVSASVFRDLCEACNVGPVESRDLFRFMRANARAKEDGSTLGEQLSTVDYRTRTSLFERSGIRLDSRSLPVQELILKQTLVPTSRKCLQVFAHRAANEPLFFEAFESHAEIRRRPA